MECSARCVNKQVRAADDIHALCDSLCTIHACQISHRYRVVVVEELPRTGTNKVQKAALLELFGPDPAAST